MKSNNRIGITAGGTWIVDYSKVVSKFPDEGGCASLLSETVSNGGAPYNLLVDLRRLGAGFPLRAVGCVGQDVDGSSILKDCQAHNIDTRQMRVVPEAPTSFSDVMIAMETGVRTSFNYPGANAFLNADDFDLQENPSRIFFLGTLMFLAGLDDEDSRHGSKAAAVLAKARSRGMLTCIDIERTNLAPASFEKQVHAALKETDIAIFNVEVAEILTGIRIRYTAGIDTTAASRAASTLMSIGKGECAVIRFPAGALALSQDGKITVEGSIRVPKSRIRSAAGSGHAFAAGFLHEYHDLRPISDCLKAGHAAAASCIMDPTTSGGVRELSACLDLLNQYGQREIKD